MSRYKKENGEGNGKSIAFLFIPYLCAIVATILIVIFIFINFADSGMVQLLFNRIPTATLVQSDINTTLILPVEEQKEFPVIAYKSQWATLNVDGWERQNIPVLLGDTSKILKKGAGTPMFTEFCGFGSRVVMEAHVTSFFREIENTAVGTPVHVSTIYGQYEYRVEKIVFFDKKDSTYIYPNHDREELVLYTCYPFDNGFRPRVQRIALICTLESGKQWRKEPW